MNGMAYEQADTVNTDSTKKEKRYFARWGAIQEIVVSLERKKAVVMPLKVIPF